MTIRARCTSAFFLLALLALAIPLAAQGERGTFVILSGGRAVGTERWEVQPDGGATRATSTVSYLLTPLLALEVNAVYGATDQALQVTRRQGDASAQTFAVQQRNRVTVRRVAPAGEKASEFPGGPDVVLLADSAFAPLLRLVPLAGATPRTVKLLYPESGRRGQVRLDRQAGPGSTLIRLSGALEGEIEVGRGGEVLRISLPALGLEARPDTR